LEKEDIMNMRSLIAAIVVALAFLSAAPAAPQAGPVTVLAVKDALTTAVQGLRDALAEATNDAQSIGNSLQANAQNVLADINRMLGSKLAYTFDRLDASELRLVEDAQALTQQMTVATQKIVSGAGDEARRTLTEADITAYNASYSLPCRDARPRIVASFPARLTVGRDTPVLKLHGNFLRQGAEPSVKVNATAARLVERLDNSLSVEIPNAVLESATNAEVLVSVEVAGLETTRRSLWLWGLLGCHESTSNVTAIPLALTTLEPPFRYRVKGTEAVEYTAFREVAEPVQHFSNIGSDRCDDNYRIDRQWCITGPGTLVRADVGVTSANCNSGYEGWVPSGDRCVLVRGKVGGCGANRGLFGTWLGCRGRGWLNYDITLVRREPYQVVTEPLVIEREGRPAELAFTIEVPPSVGFERPMARYNLQVDKLQGPKLVETFAVSHANPTVGPVTSRVSGGLLSVEVQP
jgi:hypothetical protein